MKTRKTAAQVLIENPSILCQAVDVLAELAGRLGTEQTYSIGFQRWQKLTMRQRKALWIKFDFNDEKIKTALQTRTAKELL